MALQFWWPLHTSYGRDNAEDPVVNSSSFQLTIFTGFGWLGDKNCQLTKMQFRIKFIHEIKNSRRKARESLQRFKEKFSAHWQLFIDFDFKKMWPSHPISYTNINGKQIGGRFKGVWKFKAKNSVGIVVSDVISHKMPSNSSIGHSTAIKHSLSQPWAINNRRLIAQRRSGQNSKSDSWETGRFSSNFSQSNFLKMSDHSDQEVEPDFDSSRRFSKDSKHGREEVMAETSQGPGDPGVLRQVGSLRWTSTIIFSLL